jgi:hypothetical protein
MSESEMQAELERLRAENAQLKSKDKGGLTLKGARKAASLCMAWAGFQSRSTKNNGARTTNHTVDEA